MNKFRVVVNDFVSAFVEGNRKIKIKSSEFSRISEYKDEPRTDYSGQIMESMKRSSRSNALETQKTLEEMSKGIDQYAASRRDVYPKTVAPDEVLPVSSQTQDTKEHRYSFEQENGGWKDNSTVTVQAPKEEATKESFENLLKRLDPDADGYSYLVVSNGITKVEQAERNRDDLLNEKSRGEQSREESLIDKKDEIARVKQEYSERLRALEEELTGLANESHAYTRTMNTKVKDAEGVINATLRSVSSALKEARVADEKTKQALALQKEKDKIVGNISSDFLGGLNRVDKEEEPPKRLSNVFDVLNVSR